MYQLTLNGVVRLSDNAHIPQAEGNRDWVEYQQWVAEGNEPEPMPAIALNDARAKRLEDNNASYEAATSAITADYPQSEKDTWPTQDKEIKAWQADPEHASTPWIDLAASVRGIPRKEYLQRTLAKTQQFEQVSAYLTGLRQRYEDQIKAAATVEILGSIALNYGLPESLA